MSSPSYPELLSRLEALEAQKRTRGALTELTKPPFGGSVSPPGARPGGLTTPREEARTWSDDLCRRLHDAIARETPAGLGHWPRAWDLVEAPSRVLLDRLAAWESSGAEADRRAARQQAGAVLEAWREAAQEWGRAGRPGVNPSRDPEAP